MTRARGTQINTKCAHHEQLRGNARHITHPARIGELHATGLVLTGKAIQTIYAIMTIYAIQTIYATGLVLAGKAIQTIYSLNRVDLQSFTRSQLGTRMPDVGLCKDV